MRFRLLDTYFSFDLQVEHEKGLDLMDDVVGFLFLIVRNCQERHLGTFVLPFFQLQERQVFIQCMYLYNLQHPWSEMSGSCFIKNWQGVPPKKVGIVQTLPPEMMIVEVYTYLYTCKDIYHTYLDLFQNVCFSYFQRNFDHGKSQIYGDSMVYSLQSSSASPYCSCIVLMHYCVNWRIWLQLTLVSRAAT